MANWFKIVIAVFLPSLLSAQYQNIKFEYLTVEDGLSSSRTTSILQDSKRFIWIATRDGLNKYDGYTFTVYRNDPADSNSLSSNNITHIYEDHEANLWISTIGGGLKNLILRQKHLRAIFSIQIIRPVSAPTIWNKPLIINAAK